MEGWRRHYNDVRPHSALGVSPAAMATPLSLLIPPRFMTRDRMEETKSPQRTITYLGVDHDSRNAQLLNFVYEEISQTPTANSSVSRSFLNFLEAKKHSSNKRLGLKSTVY